MKIETEPKPAARRTGAKSTGRAKPGPAGAGSTAAPAKAPKAAAAKAAPKAAAAKAASGRARPGSGAKETVVASARKTRVPRVPAPPSAGQAPEVAAVAAVKEPVGATGVVHTLRRKDLIERVAKTSGAKKKAVREIVEATLRVLGDALEAGETLALPPFGKAKVNRHRDLASGEMLTVKLRRSGPRKTKGPAAEPLAEPVE